MLVQFPATSPAPGTSQSTKLSEFINSGPRISLALKSRAREASPSTLLPCATAEAKVSEWSSQQPLSCHPLQESWEEIRNASKLHWLFILFLQRKVSSPIVLQTKLLMRCKQGAVFRGGTATFPMASSIFMGIWVEAVIVCVCVCVQIIREVWDHLEA